VQPPFSNDLFGQMRAGIQGGLNVSNLYIADVFVENAGFGVNVGFDVPIVVRTFYDSTKSYQSVLGGNF
jgi:hypothetical protein